MYNNYYLTFEMKLSYVSNSKTCANIKNNKGHLHFTFIARVGGHKLLNKLFGKCINSRDQILKF